MALLVACANIRTQGATINLFKSKETINLDYQYISGEISSGMTFNEIGVTKASALMATVKGRF